MSNDSEPGDKAGPEFSRLQMMKLAIDLGPLAVFLVAWLAFGIKVATGAIMVASVTAMIASSRLLGRISPALILTTVLVVGFGGLTLLLDDPRFIQIKPTVVYMIFAAGLWIGQLTGRPVLQLMLGEAMSLSREGWRILSIRWAGFFAAMAVLNELVRQFCSEGVWVADAGSRGAQPSPPPIPAQSRCRWLP